MTEKKEESADLSKALSQYENMEKQLEVLLIQRNQLKIQLSEIKHATEELKHATGEVYKSVGSLVIKTTKNKAEADLKERKELIEVKLNAIEKEEEKIRVIIKEMQERLKKQMKEYGQKTK